MATNLQTSAEPTKGSESSSRTTGLSQTSTCQSVELNGVRMDYSLCRNGYGKPVVHGFIGNEHVLSCQLLRFSEKSALRAAISRLQQILAEGKVGER